MDKFSIVEFLLPQAEYREVDHINTTLYIKDKRHDTHILIVNLHYSTQDVYTINQLFI